MSKLLPFLLFYQLSCFAQTITRGPYLQMGGEDRIQVRWQTDQAIETHIKFGTDQNNLTGEISDPNLALDHYITLSNLISNTKYFYAIYNGNTLLEGNGQNFFVTHPTIGSSQKIRIWATGDCGTGTPNQIAVINQMEAYLGNNYLDAWLLLGDNAYYYGDDSDYQLRFFDPYQSHRLMKQTAIYPSPGNHDYANHPDRQLDHYVAYYDIFDVPVNGEIGGVPSGTEHYYSYDIGNIHLVSIDSYGKDGTPTQVRLSDSTNSPQIAWLKQDLAANTKDWTILYWHHPPYTMGSHNSDTEPELRYIREQVVPILDKFNVDLVLNGHSHTYERSKPMKYHYGLENTYNPSVHSLSSSSGKYDGSTDSCPYLRSDQSKEDGIIYMVAGSAGWATTIQSAYPHDAMYYSNYTNAGSTLLEINGDTLKAIWLTENGLIADHFTMLKHVKLIDSLVVLPPNPASVILEAGPKFGYNWERDNSNLRTINIANPQNNQVFHVTDSYGCLPDKFTISTSQDCVQSKTLTGLIESSSNLDISASQTITGKNILSEGATMIYSAGNNIVLEPGFRADQGSVFRTNLIGCGGG